MDKNPLNDLFLLLSNEMQSVDDLISERMFSEHAPLIQKLTSHLINAGGKRLRPLLTLASANICNYQGKHHIHLAAIVEFIHTATLLHDDVVDESNLRRGKKTANMIWGNEFSVLAGDFLFAQSFELMVETGSIEALSSLATASCKITQGEFQQMQISNKPDTSIENYFEVIGKKTAELFGASCESGVIVASGSVKQQKAAYDYGYNLGLAFQIVDDLLDVEGDIDTIGKPGGQDAKVEKATLVAKLGVEEARHKAVLLISESIEALKLWGSEADHLRSLAQFVLERQK